jgi:hypothetical protein
VRGSNEPNLLDWLGGRWAFVYVCPAVAVCMKKTKKSCLNEAPSFKLGEVDIRGCQKKLSEWPQWRPTHQITSVTVFVHSGLPPRRVPRNYLLLGI